MLLFGMDVALLRYLFSSLLSLRPGNVTGPFLFGTPGLSFNAIVVKELSAISGGGLITLS